MPAASINTVVEAEPGSCREAARWLTKLYNGVFDLGTGLHRAESESEPVWEGEAGDAFRVLVSDNAGDADQVAEFLNRTKIALEKFADTIATVTSRIDQARMVAQSGGLVVTATTIEPPQEPDVELYSPAPGADNDRSPEEQRIIANYRAKLDVYQEVDVTIEDARDEEKSAHASLTSALKMMNDFTSYLVPKGWAWGPVVTGLYSGPFTVAKALTEAAATAQARAQGALDVLADPTLTPTDRQKVLSNQLMWAAEVKAAKNSAMSSQNLDGKIPGGARLKGIAGFNVKGIGAAGVLVTTAQTYQAIQDGVPPDKAVTKATAQTATGAAVGVFMTAAASAGYITGVAATGGTLLVGTVLVAGVGYYVDHHYYD